MPRQVVSFDSGFIKDIERLAKMLDNWGTEGPKRLMKAHGRIGQRWKAEAVKRVPRRKGTLAERIVTNSYPTATGPETECGSNVPYAPFTEFGTRHIAGGRVQALGTGPEITDAQSVKDWPAKAGGGVVGTTGATGALQDALDRRNTRGAASEQMPWLRPAFNSIKTWALEQLMQAIEPPKK